MIFLNLMLDIMCGYYCGKLYEYFLYFGNVEVFDCLLLLFFRYEFFMIRIGVRGINFFIVNLIYVIR